MAFIAGIVGAIGSIMGGIAAANQAKYQQAVAKNNAKIAEMNAEHAVDVGIREQEAFKIKASNLISAQRAVQAASGVDVSVGSPLLVRAGARSMEALDVETIRAGAERRAFDFRSQRMNFLAQSDLYGMEAENAMTQGILGGIGGIASAFGSVSSKWSSWRSPVPYTPASSPVTYTAPTAPLPGLSSPLVPAVPSYRTGPGGTLVGGI